jgi:hypothetical protein
LQIAVPAPGRKHPMVMVSEEFFRPVELHWNEFGHFLDSFA